MAAPRIKMRLQTITAPGNGTVVLQLACAYNQSVQEDQQISAVFPDGQMTIVCADAPTIAGLQIGAAYYADFSLALVQPPNVLNK